MFKLGLCVYYFFVRMFSAEHLALYFQQPSVCNSKTVRFILFYINTPAYYEQKASSMVAIGPATNPVHNSATCRNGPQQQAHVIEEAFIHI